MDHCSVEVACGKWAGDAGALASPGLLGELGLATDRPYTLRFGIRRAQTHFRAGDDHPPGRLTLPAPLAERLCLEPGAQLTAALAAHGEVVLGPLVGVLISRTHLNDQLKGTADAVYSRYAHHGREAGAVLCFFSADDLDPEEGVIRGYLLREGGYAWEARRVPVPAVIYDRCFGAMGRPDGSRVRELAERLGSTVVNRPMKITKLQAFAVLKEDPDLAPHLPFTVPYTPDALRQAVERYTDLYLKPNALYKGKGVYRLTRQGKGWRLQSQEDGGAGRCLPDSEAVSSALIPLEKKHEYVMQEGLALATYLGNRFDFRCLVQRNGRGEWGVTGLVARIAPVGGTVTSPRSGGQVAHGYQALRHAFPDRWQAVLHNLEELSLRMASQTDAKLGPCVELGLDLGVIQDGTAKLIEVNGKPLRVSLQRLGDPLISEQIHRFPIHCAAALDLRSWGDVTACTG